MANKIALTNKFPDITKSNKLYERAKDLIPSQTQTLAKGPGQYTKNIAPKYLQRGKGSHVWDVDGNEFIDYQMGIGPLSLGYCYDKVDQAIIEQLKEGITFSMMHPLEVEVAELINNIVPNAECVRYSKTGADVTSAAVRIARAYTGKNKVLCCGYHGWHDWYISVTDRSAGIPDKIKDLTYTFNYNEMHSVLDAIDEDTACIILEPFVFDAPSDNFLHNLRKICDEENIVLIFDEMWTGFRIALGGAQEYFNIKADLACFSKAVANGMPLSILTGKREYMDLLEKDVFFYTTFGGEALSLAAAKAVINEMQEKDVPAYLYEQGKNLKDGFNEIVAKCEADFLKCVGYNCRTMVSINSSAGNALEIKTLIQQELIKRGILWGGFHNISFSHSDEDIEYTLNAYKEIIPFIKKAADQKNIRSLIKGELLEPVFRKTSNFNTKPKKSSVV